MADVMVSDIEKVVVQIPADTGYLSLCRVNASAVGAMLGFGIDALDDLRLAVTEAVTWSLAGAAPDSRMELAVAGSAGTLTFRVEAEAGPDATDHMDDLASGILGAMVDDCSTSLVEGRLSIWFEKSVSLA